MAKKRRATRLPELSLLYDGSAGAWLLSLIIYRRLSIVERYGGDDHSGWAVAGVGK